MSNIEANTITDTLTNTNALADQRILKHISFVVMAMMGVAVAIAVTASNVA